jgi:hypothetical protein
MEILLQAEPFLLGAQEAQTLVKRKMKLDGGHWKKSLVCTKYCRHILESGTGVFPASGDLSQLWAGSLK